MEKKEGLRSHGFAVEELPRCRSIDRLVLLLVGVLMTCHARAQSRTGWVGHCIGLDAKSVREKTKKVVGSGVDVR